MERKLFDLSVEELHASLGIGDERCKEMHERFHAIVDDLLNKHAESKPTGERVGDLEKRGFDIRQVIQKMTDLAENDNELYYALYQSGRLIEQIQQKYGTPKAAFLSGLIASIISGRRSNRPETETKESTFDF